MNIRDESYLTIDFQHENFEQGDLGGRICRLASHVGIVVGRVDEYRQLARDSVISLSHCAEYLWYENNVNVTIYADLKIFIDVN